MVKLRWSRAFLFALVDALLYAASLYGALNLRFDFLIPRAFYLHTLRLLPLYVLLMLGCGFFFGLYNRLWKYASVEEGWAIIKSVSVGSALSISAAYYLNLQIPRSLFIIAWLLSIGLTGGIRLVARVGSSRGWYNDFRGGKPVLIVGAGDAGATVVRELQRYRENHYNPVGFVDDDPKKQGLYLYGLPVLGARADLPRLVKRYGIEEVIAAMPSAPGSVFRELVQVCNSLGVELKTVPRIYALLEGTVATVRKVDVEDLLCRPPVKVNLEEIASYLNGEVVLVTGAGGSIGSELCRQVARFNPRLLVLLDHSENDIFEVTADLRIKFPNLHMQPVIVDVRDRVALDSVFRRYQPGVVFHAAAHKHVPYMESFPEEAIKTNVFGTYNVAMAARDSEAKRFILISTDKAVNPVSIMGATKRLAEMIIQVLHEEGLGAGAPGRRADAGSTRFMAVRFGNVLGSRGSVVPLFQKQIAAGGPVTITHPDMKRYFMTIPEAVQLVIQAGAMGQGGEIFVLDMGEPVSIMELAENMIRLLGLEPGKDIEIKTIGPRPGEKLSEEIFSEKEGLAATKHQRIFVSRSCEVERNKLTWALKELRRLVGVPQGDGVSAQGGGGETAVSMLRPTGHAGIVDVLNSVIPGCRCTARLENEEWFLRQRSSKGAETVAEEVAATK